MNTNADIEFRPNGGTVEMWVERDVGPFDEYLCGVFRRHRKYEGNFVFHPSNGVEMTCRMMRKAMEEAGRLNSDPKSWATYKEIE